MNISFPTEAGKQYLVQGTPVLTSAFSPTGITWTGTGGPKTLTVPKGSNAFFRVQVQDIDSDLDGLSNWVENATGQNPNSLTPSAGAAEYAYVTGQVALPNLVTIKVIDPFASVDGLLHCA